MKGLYFIMAFIGPILFIVLTKAVFIGIILFILFMVNGFILDGLRKIPADPPHIAVVTIFGERTRRIKREGWRFFPLSTFWYDYILIDMSKKNQDFPPQIVRTRDLAELEILVSLTWIPNEDYAIEYLNNGGEDGVKTILADMVVQRLREWAIAMDKGPKDWEDALRAQDDATAMLIKAIAGFSPTLFSNIEQEQIIRKVAQGNGVQPIPQLGITLNRLNVKEIKPRGELARAAELLVKEQRERVGEKLEIQHVQNMILELKNILGITNEQALEIIQTERGKVTKKIQEIKGTVSVETLEKIEHIIGLFRK